MALPAGAAGAQQVLNPQQPRVRVKGLAPGSRRAAALHCGEGGGVCAGRGAREPGFTAAAENLEEGAGKATGVWVARSTFQRQNLRGPQEGETAFHGCLWLPPGKLLLSLTPAIPAAWGGGAPCTRALCCRPEARAASGSEKESHLLPQAHGCVPQALLQ